MLFTISLTSCWTIYDLENLRVSYEIREYLKNLKTVWGYNLVSSFHCNNEPLALALIKYEKRYEKFLV